jgi:threonine dehydrogenase-like Zn-dependent dehydrogenase
MEKGDVLGHETMGEVVEVGSENKALKVGDRVVIPFTISCGEYFFCKRGFYSGCERSNPNAKAAEKLWGHSPAGLERVEKGEIDPSFVITHRAPLEQGPELYKTFRDKKDGCIKVVLKP